MCYAVYTPGLSIIHLHVKPAIFLYGPNTDIETLCDFGSASVRFIPIVSF